MAESLSARNIVKHYGGVVALSDGNLEVQAREVVALIGANGSGKSTMSKVINGVVVLDGGQLLLDGKPVHFPSPQAAKNMGICNRLSGIEPDPADDGCRKHLADARAAQAVWVGGSKSSSRRGPRNCSRYLKGPSKLTFIPTTSVASLPPDEKQIIEILKAISFDPWLIILDEATASLDSRQVQRLFDLVAKWKEQGKAIVFVSHRMEEIFRIADKYTCFAQWQNRGRGEYQRYQ